MKTKIFPYNLRLKLGLTLSEMAGLLECDLSQISMVEYGKRNVPSKAVSKIIQLESAIAIAENDTDFIVDSISNNSIFELFSKRKKYVLSQQKIRALQLEIQEKEIFKLTLQVNELLNKAALL